MTGFGLAPGTISCRWKASPQPVPEPGWLRMEWDEDSFIRLPARVGGYPARAGIDSAAGRSVIDSKFAASRGIDAAFSESFVGLTGEVRGAISGAIDVAVGTTVIRLGAAALLDLEGLARAQRRPLDVMLGREIVLACLVDLDCPGRRVRFLPSQGPRLDGEEWLALSPNDNLHFCCDVMLDAGRPIAASVDLGSTSPIYVSPELAARERLLDGLKIGTTAAVGVEGLAVMRVATLPVLRLGGHELRDVPIAVPETWALDAEAVIGLPILSRFRCQMDFKNARMRLLPGPSLDAPFSRDRSGLHVLGHGDRLEIVHVSEASPAARAGLGVGEAILAVDDIPISPAFLAAHKGMGRKPAGTCYRLTLGCGGVRRLVLEDYF